MLHTQARGAIVQLLQERGFAERGVWLTLSAQTCTRQPDTNPCRLTALTCAAQIPARGGQPLAFPAPVPADPATLCQQLCPLVIEHANNIGLQLASLAGLVLLWPHASSEERIPLRQRFLAGLADDIATPCPSPRLTTTELIRWQSDSPTSFGVPQVQLANLKRMLEEPTAAGAYHVLADHLGLTPPFAALARVLGSLTIGARLRRNDPQRDWTHVLLGTVACEQLVPYATAEHLAVLVAQLSHRLWWLSRSGEDVALASDRWPRVGSPTLTTTSISDATSVVSAQRAARVLAQDPAAFWHYTWQTVEQLLHHPGCAWMNVFGVVHAIAWRSHESNLSPDDAALIGMTLYEALNAADVSPITARHTSVS